MRRQWEEAIEILRTLERDYEGVELYEIPMKGVVILFPWSDEGSELYFLSYTVDFREVLEAASKEAESMIRDQYGREAFEALGVRERNLRADDNMPAGIRETLNLRGYQLHPEGEEVPA